MTAREQPRGPGVTAPARGVTTCPTCGHTTIPARLCAACRHPEESHNLSAKQVRTGCSRSEGPKATPCGCKAFTPSTLESSR